jgi:homoserine O-acetyltransferase
MLQGRDANDFIYAVDASRTYNPWLTLAAITAPLLWINFADDQVNPVSLNIAPDAMARMPRARFHLVPADDETRGHLTLLTPEKWSDALARFLAEIG